MHPKAQTSYKESEGSDFGCSWEVQGMLTVGNPSTMRSVLGHNRWRGAIGERGERAGDKGAATGSACRWSQRLLAANSTSKKHILPMEEVN